MEGELSAVVRAVRIDRASSAFEESAWAVAILQRQCGMLVRAPPDNNSLGEVAFEIGDLFLEELRLAQAAELAFIDAHELAPFQLREINREFLAWQRKHPSRRALPPACPPR